MVVHSRLNFSTWGEHKRSRDLREVKESEGSPSFLIFILHDFVDHSCATAIAHQASGRCAGSTLPLEPVEILHCCSEFGNIPALYCTIAHASLNMRR